MATKAKTKKTEFPVFVRMMAKALRMGREHRTSRRAQSTPLELAVNLKVPGAEARSLYVLYLRESYLAGYNFERD